MVLGPILCSYKQGAHHGMVSTRQQDEVKLHRLWTSSKEAFILALSQSQNMDFDHENRKTESL